jgi:hypothetical protein
MKKLARVIGFTLFTAALLVAALVGTSRARVGDTTVLRALAGNPIEPGGRYQSLRRFREAAERGHVDVVFFGSSHAYRGFDPRIFADAGWTSMNLGSTNQTPLNSTYVAERYLPSLSPRLVIVELYYASLAGDGLESTRDLTVNTPSSWPMQKMAIATWNVGAMTFAAAKALRLDADESRAEQQLIRGETYVAGGYCESEGHRAGPVEGDPIVVDIAPAQLRWLVSLTEQARAGGARVVWVTHPLPPEHAARIARRAEMRAAIERAAERASVPYWDFGETMTLDPIDDFLDAHHLSQSGVEKFDRALLARLAEDGILR